MQPFTYSQRRAIAGRASRAAAEPGARYIAGGTDLLELMKDDVETPDRLVDINRAAAGAIEIAAGRRRAARRAGAHDATSPAHPDDPQAATRCCPRRCSAASPQIRNMATIGGNLLQRTRCAYFRDPAFALQQARARLRLRGASTAYNRIHAILGASDQCIATHPGDMAVALVALDARGRADRRPAASAASRSPTSTAARRHPARRDGAEHRRTDHRRSSCRPRRAARRSHYLKVRDRASFEFALVSAAVALDIDGGTIRERAVAAGGVGTKPWRAAGGGSGADRQAADAGDVEGRCRAGRRRARSRRATTGSS